MDALNLPGSSDTRILSELDKKILIKYYKEGNKNKTYVYGIFDFVPEPEVKTFVKFVKQKLGCSGIIGEDPVKDDAKDADPKKKPKGGFGNRANKTTKDPSLGKALIFSGNQTEAIRAILIERKVADEDHIKV